MSVAELCDICESRQAVHTCRRCGASVCDRHFDDETGLCADCADSLTGREDVSPAHRDVDPDDLLR
jgi:RecJ-like exonuclease